MSRAGRRLLATLQCIPRAPRWTTLAALQRSLVSEGHDAERRSVQRDLQTLAHMFPIHSDGGRPAHWSWAADAPPLQLPGMDPSTALVFQLAHSLIGPFLPKRVRERLAPQFLEADRLHGSGFTRKVRLIGDGVPRQAPDIDATVLEVVADALYLGRQVSLLYVDRSGTSQTLRTSPIGLAGRGNRLSLIVWTGESQRLLLHAIRSATLLPKPAEEPEGFDLDAYIDSGQLHFRFSAQRVLLALEFDAGLHDYLTDQRLSPEQLVVRLDAERFVLYASVADTSTLRAWLLGMGGRVKVTRPKAIVDWVAENARAAAAQYA